MKCAGAVHFTKSALLYVVLTMLATSGFAQELSAANTSRPLEKGWWEWTVYITGAPKVLKQIECVEYTLHPTFPKPVNRVCSIGDDRYPFALSATGWGTFRVGIRVFLSDGQVSELTHDLKFSAETPPSGRHQ
jgi:transcription initiation factor IIF auxiliary subunit